MGIITLPGTVSSALALDRRNIYGQQSRISGAFKNLAPSLDNRNFPSSDKRFARANVTSDTKRETAEQIAITIVFMGGLSPALAINRYRHFLCSR